MITLKDCDIVICDSSWMGRGVVYYVVIGDKMVSLIWVRDLVVGWKLVQNFQWTV